MHAGPHLQQIALKMAEAVVKFELLSANPKATVRRLDSNNWTIAIFFVVSNNCLGQDESP